MVDAPRSDGDAAVRPAAKAEAVPRINFRLDVCVSIGIARCSSACISTWIEFSASAVPRGGQMAESHDGMKPQSWLSDYIDSPNKLRR
jgi:hypothetical protein